MSENTSPDLIMQQPSSSVQPTVTTTTPIAQQNDNSSPTYSGNPLFSKAKNLKVILGGLVGLILVVTGGYWIYANYFMSPLGLLKEAVEKMEVDSIKLGFDAQAEDVTVAGTIIAHEKGFSQADFTIGLVEEGVQHDFDLSFIADTKDVYFQMNYNYMQLLLSQADLMVPGIGATQTFALLQPVVTGQSWLHMMIPEEEQLATDSDEYLAEYEQFGEKLAEALVVKDFSRNTEYQGKKYDIISLGVDKEKLLVAIDALKDLDLSTEVSEINNFKKAIEDMGELKETLVVVYLDADGYIRMVDLYAPQGASESIQDAIEQQAETKSPLMAQFSQVTAVFQPDKGVKEGESVKFMTMTFDDYGSAETVIEPTKTVEWEEVMLHAQSEFAPIFYQYMMMQQAQPGMNQGGYPVQESVYPGQTYPAGVLPNSSDGMPINFMQMLNQ